MNDDASIVPVPEPLAAAAHADNAKYREMYEESLRDPDRFWQEQAKAIPVDSGAIPDLKRDVCLPGCVHQVVRGRSPQRLRELRRPASRDAWRSDSVDLGAGRTGAVPAHQLSGTARPRLRMANVLKSLGVAKGDRVVLYMPMIPEAVYAMLACARIGAVHSVVFGGFSPDALANRIEDSGAKLVVTANEGLRGGRRVPLKRNADKAVEGIDGVQVLVVACTDAEVPMLNGRDHAYDALAASASGDCPAEPMNAEDPLFILYTSGSTGKPKGVLHTTGGYLLYASMTHRYVFDYRDGEIFWCTADVGWVTGHSYIVYGPLANGATSLIFEGVPTYPTPSRFWEVCQVHGVQVFYTAPTALRSLMGLGDSHVVKCDLSSLRVLGTVGEPINPEAWKWYHRVVGQGRCPVVDTWWQTETGGILIAPLPGATALKPGSATLPFFGIEPAIVDSNGREIEATEAEGSLVIKRSWPGQMRTLFGNHKRFVQTYFETYKGTYFTSDGARRDADGYYWITGRVDDVLNVSGHRMGTAEVESALVAHKAVAEAAVVGYPHGIKGQGIYCYVTLMAGMDGTEELRRELVLRVRKEIGPFAGPDQIQFAPDLPKTPVRKDHAAHSAQDRRE